MSIQSSKDLFLASLKREFEALDVAFAWVPDGELVQESYVNLIPTPQHGTHVNGLRSGVTEAVREFVQSLNLSGIVHTIEVEQFGEVATGQADLTALDIGKPGRGPAKSFRYF